MATPDNTSTRRPRLVDNEHDPDAAASPEGELTAIQAAAFAATVVEANQSAIDHTLDQMSADQLRSLAIALASQVNASENATGEVADVGPDGICAIAVATAAQSFGTTRDAVLSADRHRAVTDARAVARPRPGAAASHCRRSHRTSARTTRPSSTPRTRSPTTRA